jgi:hypothetical protein
MALESNRESTYPHDYRLICAGREAPTVVGGQAVNLWAISYLNRKDSDLRAAAYGSKDLDILADKKVIDHLKTVPGWVFKPNSPRNWLDSRQGFLHGTSEDGRKLLVEVLHSVHGLEKTDLARVETVEHRGYHYRLLDPVVMLKAKAANVRDLKQDDTPPRHDRLHLQLIARCVPLYLRDVHRAAMSHPSIERESLNVIGYAFKTLQNAKTARTLEAEGIAPASLIPVEFKESPLARIRAAFEWQFRLLENPARRMKTSDGDPTPSVRTPRPPLGPRLGM